MRVVFASQSAAAAAMPVMLYPVFQHNHLDHCQNLELRLLTTSWMNSKTLVLHFTVPAHRSHPVLHSDLYSRGINSLFGGLFWYVFMEVELMWPFWHIWAKGKSDRMPFIERSQALLKLLESAAADKPRYRPCPDWHWFKPFLALLWDPVWGRWLSHLQELHKFHYFDSHSLQSWLLFVSHALCRSLWSFHYNTVRTVCKLQCKHWPWPLTLAAVNQTPCTHHTSL